MLPAEKAVKARTAEDDQGLADVALAIFPAAATRRAATRSAATGAGIAEAEGLPQPWRPGPVAP